MRILLVEDQATIASSIKKGLEEKNCTVTIATNGMEGYTIGLTNTFDIIVLDVMMPALNGIDVCRKLREDGIQIPILFLSALDSVEDKVLGLRTGGDDYLAKPFDFDELYMRIYALHRRNIDKKSGNQNVIKFGLQIDWQNKTVLRDGKKIELTNKEFKLLEYFLQNVGKVVSKQEIATNVWDIDFDTGTNIVEVYVNYLRNKLDKNFDNKLIHTKFGIGYIFQPE